jgi:hypothetical protein
MIETMKVFDVAFFFAGEILFTGAGITEQPNENDLRSTYNCLFDVHVLTYICH